jgi:hypothetical protein
MLFQGLVAFLDPLQIGVVHRHFLLEDKHQVGPPGAFETLGDGVSTGVNPRMAQRRERLRIPLAGSRGRSAGPSTR